ncbi:amidohydrolase [Streptomyces sp. NL15-2K]|uniref:amidohydrolase n=1 Tax=Streptomyces sp. NL15-2K TaxID=376149 RepID=UPI000F57DD34|nr:MULTISPECIES: amidohydrolase [Actinomycetes]WKX07222.1 amidohydrolase [Kutzneria buriramensis]GCB51578.1 peptidase M20D [Streptomyces sp. NL15-2K]
MTLRLPHWVPALYESLHRGPELGFREHRTAGLLAEVLGREGFAVTRGIGGTGLTAVLGSGPGPVVAARAELDALPLQERTGEAFASEVDGVMHACGHDLHLAALAGAAAQLAARPDLPPGRIVLILQPAEELGSGAARMVDDGLAEAVPRLDLLLGQHVSAMAPVGVLVSTPGTALAATDTLTVTARAPGGHTGSPDSGPDPVLFAASVTQRLHTVVGRDVPPFEQAVVSVPGIVAPSAPGLRAPCAAVTVNIRTFDERVRETILDRVEALVRAEAAAAGLAFGDDVRLTRDTHVPRVENTARIRDRLAALHESRLSVRHLTVPPALASDDVSVLIRAFGCPAVYWFVGSGEPGGRLGRVRPACHTDEYLPHPATLAVATAAMREALLAGLSGDLSEPAGQADQPALTG